MERNNIDFFYELLKGGLWGNDVFLHPFGEIDYTGVIRIAEEQSVVGLITAGIDKVKDVKVPQNDVLQLIGSSLQIEQQNLTMNQFVADLVGQMREKGIYTLLVKGQGIAQCYEKPLWRACGDVDLFLSSDNYQKAQNYLLPLASSVDPEGLYEKHLGMVINSQTVELHGSLKCGLSSRIDKVLDFILEDTFKGGNVRSWDNNGTQIFMLGVENDVFYVFTHFLSHFYKGGIGLRQICDWCRLLWTFRESLNHGLLESRIKKAGLMSEWKAFYNLANRYLGMPDLGSGLTIHDSRFDKKADRIMEFILKSGNMGHNRDMSHFSMYPYLIRKCVSMGRRIGDLINHARIFPLDSLRFFPRIMFNGVRSAIRGE